MGRNIMPSEMCRLCSQPGELYSLPSGGAKGFKCSRCGEYLITDTAFTTFRYYPDKKDFYMLSGFVKNENMFGNSKPMITNSMLPDKDEFKTIVLANAPKTVQEKADLALRFLAVKIGHPGKWFAIDASQDYTIAYCQTEDEFNAYLRYMHDSQLIDFSPERNGNNRAYIRFGGWQRIETITKGFIEKDQAFVAMRFKPSLNKVFVEGIEPLGAPEETGYLMRRIDRKEFNGDVVDEIMAEIRRSRFLIADVTILNNGVFLEAGFASGLGKPVIWTCRKSAFERHSAHFDTNHMNHILWDSPEDLRQKLKNRILATLGHARGAEG